MRCGQVRGLPYSSQHGWTNLYNEVNLYAAAWLRNLSAAGHIAQGDVDERSICEITPDDLTGAVQFHTFAGIGAWSYALRLAGWPDDRPVWTGSCPCQPFSAAGKRGGFDDDRHLWPDWFRLIRECRPDVVFGEQVASPDGYHWLDLVRSDLEGAGYAVGVAVLPAAGVGAPHGRHRIFFVADARGQRRDRLDARLPGRRQDEDRVEAAGSGDAGGKRAVAAEVGECVADTATGRRGAAVGAFDPRRGEPDTAGGRSVLDAHPWRGVAWLPCRDGKARPTQPGLLPLAHGSAGRMARLRPGFDGSADYPIAPVLKGAGNAIVPQVAAVFIRAFLECCDG